MSTLRQFLIVLLLFSLAVGATLGWRILHVHFLSQEPFTPTHVAQHLPAPQQALVGQITTVVGDVAKYARSATQSASVNPGDSLLQGEELQIDGSSSTGITQRNSPNSPEISQATLVFSPLLTVTAGNKADLSFVQTLPDAFVVSQLDGQATYMVAPEQHVSVRALHALFELDAAQAGISIKDKKIEINLASGSAKIGYVNKNNDTIVESLEATAAARLAEFNDASRQVKLKLAP